MFSKFLPHSNTSSNLPPPNSGTRFAGLGDPQLLLSGLISQVVLEAQSLNGQTPSNNVNRSRIGLSLQLIAQGLNNNPALNALNTLKMADSKVANNLTELVYDWINFKDSQISDKIIALVCGCLPLSTITNTNQEQIVKYFDLKVNLILNLAAKIDNKQNQEINPREQLLELLRAGNKVVQRSQHQSNNNLIEAAVKLAGIATASSICFTQPIGLIGLVGVSVIQSLVNYVAHENTITQARIENNRKQIEASTIKILCYELECVDNCNPSESGNLATLQAKARLLKELVNKHSKGSSIIEGLWSRLESKIKYLSSSILYGSSVSDKPNLSSNNLTPEAQRELLERCLEVSSPELGAVRAGWQQRLLTQVCMCGVSNFFGVLANGFGAIAGEKLLQGVQFIPVQAGQVFGLSGKISEGITQVMRLEDYVKLVASHSFREATGMSAALSEQISSVFSHLLGTLGEQFFGSMENVLNFCDLEWQVRIVQPLSDSMFVDNVTAPLRNIASSGVKAFNFSNVLSSCANFTSQICKIISLSIQLPPVLPIKPDIQNLSGVSNGRSNLISEQRFSRVTVRPLRRRGGGAASKR